MPPPYPLGWIPNATFVQPDAEKALREKLVRIRERRCVSLGDRCVVDAGSNIRVAVGAARRRQRIHVARALSRRLRRRQQLCAQADRRRPRGSRLRRMVGGGGHADQRSRETSRKEPFNIAGRRGPAPSCPVPAICGAGKSSCCRAKIRRPPARRTASSALLERIYRHLRPHDLALGGLSLSCAARAELARPPRAADGRCGAPDAALPRTGTLRRHPRRRQSRLEAGTGAARRCR